MRSGIVLLGLIVTLCVAGVMIAIGTVSATSVTLELEAAADSDTDTDVVSFVFRTDDNATSVDIRDTSHSEDFGAVTFELDQWEEVDGSGSGSQSQFTADDNTRYRISYTVEASDASEGTYDFSPSITVSYQNSPTEDVGQVLTAEVDILEPSLGSISDETVDGRFTPEDDGEISENLGVEIDNNGDGYMDVDGIFVSSVPAYMNVDIDSQPDQISASSDEKLELDIEVDELISEGEKSFDVTVRHTEGPSETFQVTVDIIKPPAAGVEQSTVDLGEILVGESRSGEITFTERGGYDRISGLSDNSLTFASQSGSISFPGLDDLSINSGGSTSQEVVVEADDTAGRDEELEWEIGFTPSDPNGVSTRATFTAETIYPPYYESVSMTDSNIIFDEPRDEVDVFEDEVTVTIANGGDLEMDIQNIEATIATRDIEVDVIDNPQSIDPRSSDEIVLGVAASSQIREDDWTLEVKITANEPATLIGEGTGTTTVESTISVEHETELSVQRNEIDAGEVILTEQSTGEATVVETLGYKPVENFSVEQVAGPDQGWLTVTEQPSELTAGEESPFAVEIAFDTTAQLYETYQWTYEIDGSNIAADNITIDAVPRPIDFGDTIDELEIREQELNDEPAAAAEEMANVLAELEEILQTGEGDATRNDITVLVSAGNSMILTLDAISAAEEQLNAEEYGVSQQELARASAALNTLTLASEELTSDELQRQVEQIRDDVATVLDRLIDRQEEYFVGELEDQNISVLEKAQIQRASSRTAELAGDEGRAEELRESAEESFERYSNLVSSANEDYITAQDLRRGLADNVFISVGEQRLFLISSFSAYSSKSDEVLEIYDSAIEKLKKAGATERAGVLTDERAEIASEYESTYQFSLVLAGASGFILIVSIARAVIALYRYRVDAGKAVTGDFLLPWSEMES